MSTATDTSSTTEVDRSAASTGTSDASTDEDEQPASWARIDLTPFLDGTYEPPVPTMFQRADGVCLLYPGRTHSFHGESESGKSLVLQLEAVRILAEGGQVLYIDFEDEPDSVIGRLLDFGATREQITIGFDYRQPSVNPNSTYDELNAWTDMLNQHYDLCVIDGVTDSLSIFGFGSNENDDVAKWARLLPRNIARRTGAAVVVIDHVAKSNETRGRFAVGGQAKMNTLTGAGFTVEINKPLGKDMRGVVVLRVAKDRGGYLRSRSGPMRANDRTQEVCRVVVDSTGDISTWTIETPEGLQLTAGGAVAPFRMTGFMERISKVLEAADDPLTLRALKELVGGNKDRFAAGLRSLIDEGYVNVTTGQRNATMHASMHPYRQAADPLSDMYQGVDDLLPPVDNSSHSTSETTVADCGPTVAGHGVNDRGSVAPTPKGATVTDQVVGNGDCGRDRSATVRTIERMVAGKRVQVDPNTGEVVEP